jgi:hypothetical protein
VGQSFGPDLAERVAGQFVGGGIEDALGRQLHLGQAAPREIHVRALGLEYGIVGNLRVHDLSTLRRPGKSICPRPTADAMLSE